jgi:hypothetical protein
MYLVIAVCRHLGRAQIVAKSSDAERARQKRAALARENEEKRYAHRMRQARRSVRSQEDWNEPAEEAVEELDFFVVADS